VRKPFGLDRISGQARIRQPGRSEAACPGPDPGESRGAKPAAIRLAADDSDGSNRALGAGGRIGDDSTLKPIADRVRGLARAQGDS